MEGDLANVASLLPKTQTQIELASKVLAKCKSTRIPGLRGLLILLRSDRP